MGQQSAGPSTEGMIGSAMAGISPSTGSMNALASGGAGTDLSAVQENTSLIQNFSSWLGDTPEERETNAKAFSAMTKDINSSLQNLQDSTLQQRLFKKIMMRHAVNVTGPSQSAGGVPEPTRSFGAGATEAVTSRMGFR